MIALIYNNELEIWYYNENMQLMYWNESGYIKISCAKNLSEIREDAAVQGNIIDDTGDL